MLEATRYCSGAGGEHTNQHRQQHLGRGGATAVACARPNTIPSNGFFERDRRQPVIARFGCAQTSGRACAPAPLRLSKPSGGRSTSIKHDAEAAGDQPLAGRGAQTGRQAARAQQQMHKDLLTCHLTPWPAVWRVGPPAAIQRNRGIVFVDSGRVGLRVHCLSVPGLSS
jgi:hypothetical protein